MLKAKQMAEGIKAGSYDKELANLYGEGDKITGQRERYAEAIANEYNKSVAYFSNNHDYREFRAKQIVGFNEAYKYHCCYARFGHKAEPVAKVLKNY